MKQPAHFTFEEEDQDHLRTYLNMLVDHCCAHNYLERALLDMAETAQRLLLGSSISADKAQTELKQTLKKYKAILYDTIHLQELERLALVLQHLNTTSNLIRRSGRYQFCSDDPPPSLLSLTAAEEDQQRQLTIKQPYPCQAAFEKVIAMCATITHPQSNKM